MKRITIILLLLTCLPCMHLHAQETAKKELQSADSKWKFGVNGGYGQRVFRSGRKISAERERYIKDFKSGISYGGEVAYFPWRKVGFGVKYDRYQSKASQENELTEDVAIQFLGGEIIHKAVMKNPRNAVLTSFLLGYQPYRNRTQAGDNQFIFNGKTMGWGVSVGFEHRFTQKFALNLTGSAMMGAIYRLQRKTDFSTETLHLSKDDSVDLSRFSFSVGFSFF
ncbi:outer membrane beta-barrel protein [Dyadobacter fanqingshengii]|uniref:Outer membrane beta-barrel protein n=1 Tax=Dyadobacter fanqingshengii TaxID=2906443 RepID=A0A9X1P663_9BACT|nr:outer membrane beta-barrel protein [Dyadobacter fanqingshengii]MCF0039466.1 outer membrane beta-barrel protein [Dyadobacter fanqingshengii]USJ33725.1 outer membrane beta-barrel protein [Dyadobacter fanqingshengii]